MTTSTPLRRAESLAGLRVVHLDLWWSPQHIQTWPCNEGYEDAHTLLAAATERYPAEVSVHVADRSSYEAVQLYEESVKPTASSMTQGSWNYRVSSIFGTNQYPGCWTGREVPLLLIHFADVTVPYVAPHEGRRARNGPRERPIRTILNVLGMLHRDDQERLLDRQLS